MFLKNRFNTIMNNESASPTIEQLGLIVIAISVGIALIAFGVTAIQKLRETADFVENNN